MMPPLVTPSISISSSQQTAAQVVAAGRAFYGAVRPQVGTGVPDSEHLKLLRSFISDRLTGLLIKAEAAEAKNAKQPVPEGEGNPPLFEGDLYSPYAEGFTSFKVLEAIQQGAAWICRVRLTYQEEGSKPMVWIDKASVVFEHGRWVVDDVARLEPGETTSSTSLAILLQGIIKDGQSIAVPKPKKP